MNAPQMPEPRAAKHNEPRYYIVVAKRWVHAYLTTKDLLGDKAITDLPCSGLEFFDSKGRRYAPVIGPEGKVIDLDRTIDRANQKLVARRVRMALEQIEKVFHGNRDKVLVMTNKAMEAADMNVSARPLDDSGELELTDDGGAAGTLTIDATFFTFNDNGETLEEAVKEKANLLGLPSQERGDHTAGTSYAHRLCHAAGIFDCH